MTLLTLPLALLAMQQGIAGRLAGRVSPEVATLVVELGTAASARGLPVDPLIQKAIEGGAKGVPSERVAAAVRLVAMQLDTAAEALRQGGLASDTVVIAAGQFDLTAGIGAHDITNLVLRGGGQAEVTARLRIAGTLAAMGVPPAEVVSLVIATVRSGRSIADLLALPSLVQAEMARGVTPAQAASGLARAAAAQARHGPPPGRGQPPPHAPAPPHP